MTDDTTAPSPSLFGASATSELRGLTQAEAETRLLAEGPNELASERPRGLAAIAFEVLREPMFLLLLAAGGLYLVMGERSDAAMLLGFVGVVMAITIVQERRTERALLALRDLSSPRALVVRDGSRLRIAGREVVRGDLLVVSEGDRVAADGFLRAATHLSVDESLLTGESAPVRKAASLAIATLEAPGGDDHASVFSGTLVTAGQGLVEVAATGARSQLGRIGRALEAHTPEPTPLQLESRRLVFRFAAVGLGACAVIVVSYALLRGGGFEVWKQGLLAGITMAMAILPEEVPVVLTVFLALGAWRISRSRVLTRRMPAIERLGATTVLCVDKTGTLTHNRMVLRHLAVPGASVDLTSLDGPLPEALRSLLEHAILASRRDTFEPMERALHEAGERFLAGVAQVHASWELTKVYPLEPSLLAMSHAWERSADADRVIATKGAPEAVADLCHLDHVDDQALTAEAVHLAAQGLRVLAVARGTPPDGALPERHHDLDFELLGLVAFEDPLRATVPEAVAACHRAGIRVVLITGDYPVTAQHIARQAGVDRPDGVLTGPEINALDDEALRARLATTCVFARVVPEQKLRLVEALRASGEVVAMTGDGVNDAPALRAADIGIAMGGRGTDVAREAAALVLLDDDFSSIVEAVRLGRRIVDNIQKALGFIVAVHIPIAGLSILPAFVPDWPLLLLPVHVVFLELIVDPTCSLLFEAEQAESRILERPPRPVDEPIFSLRSLGTSAMQGLLLFGACVGVFVVAAPEQAPQAARALAFTTLVLGALALILVHRSADRSAFAMLRVRNVALWWIVPTTCLMLALVLLVPIGQRLLHFAPLHAIAIAKSVGAAVLFLVVAELLKHLTKHWRWPRRAPNPTP